MSRQKVKKMETTNESFGLIVRNLNAIKLADWQEAHPNEMPIGFEFGLKMIYDIRAIGHLREGETHGRVLSDAIDWIEAHDFYDDYDGFITSSKIEYIGNDEETVCYVIWISVQLDR